MKSRFAMVALTLLAGVLALPRADAAEASSSVMQLLQESETAMAAGGLVEAEALARRAAGLDPAWAPAWRQLGLVLLEAGRGAEAVPAFRRATGLAATEVTAWRGLAMALWQTGQADAAMAALEAYLALKPDDVVAWRDLAAWRLNKGMADKAQEALEHVLKAFPEDAIAWRDLGGVHQRQGRSADALVALERAVALQPEEPTILRDLGWCLWMVGRRSEAVVSIEKALGAGLAARDQVILQVVARLAEEGAAVEALDFYRRTRPTASLAAVGVDLARRGRLQAAEPLLLEAWRLGEQPRTTGLYLAYARAVNGRSEGVGGYLEPFVVSAAEAEPGEFDLALETLRMGTTQPEVPEMLSRIEAVVGERRTYDARITEILEKAAEEQRVRNVPDAALALYRRVLERDPNRRTWIWALQLAEQQEGEVAAAEWLTRFEKRVGAPYVRSGIAGVRAEREGDSATSVARLRESVALEPMQPPLRQLLFRGLMRLGRQAEAREETLWFARQVDEGETVLRSYLAEMWTQLGDSEQALGHWEILHLSRPDIVYYGLENAFALYRLGRPDEAMALLTDMEARGEPDARVYELLAELCAALGRTDEAVMWSERGLRLAPSQGLRRYHAENAEVAATNFPAALASAQAFLALDPGYVPMQLLAGRVLMAMGSQEVARAHYRLLLEHSPDFLPALVALRDAETRAGAFDEALALATNRLAADPGNAEAQRVYAHTAAQKSQFLTALRTVRPLAATPLEHAVPLLVYDRITTGPYPGRTTVSQVVAHVERLARDGYVFVNDMHLVETAQPTNRVVIILVDPDVEVVEALDPVLQRLGARVLVATHAGVPAGLAVGAFDPAPLAALWASGRWRQITSGPEDVRARVIDAAGLRGNPLTHPIAQLGVIEDRAAFAARLDQLLAASAQVSTGRAERILVYPGGDYGQRSLNLQTGSLAVVRAAVSNHFSHAIYFDDVGFYLPRQDTLRMPARLVPPSWDADALSSYLRAGRPPVRARLELARILYWHGQYRAAARWFARAEAAGADAVDVNYTWGLNAERQDDLRTAQLKLRRAQALDPSSAAIAEAIRQVEDRQRPYVQGFLRGWEDNEDRSYFQAGGYADVKVSERLRLGASADANTWETEGVGEEKGDRLGLRGLVYLRPGIWVEGRYWELDMENLDAVQGGSADLWLPSLFTSGHLTLGYAREEIETVEALRADIQADTYALRTYTRLFDVLDLFANGSIVDRTDGNASELVDGRLVYRLTEWKFAGVGWRFRYGDSDEDPPEYWAPEELEQHQLYLNLRGTGRRLRSSLSGEAGWAREGDGDWEFVWGARADANYYLNRHLGLGGDVVWFEGPEYERLTWRVGLTGRF